MRSCKTCKHHGRGDLGPCQTCYELSKYEPEHISCQGCAHQVQIEGGLSEACQACRQYDGYETPEPVEYTHDAINVLFQTKDMEEAKRRLAEELERFAAMPDEDRQALLESFGWPTAARGEDQGPPPAVDSKIAHGSKKSEPFRLALTEVWRVSMFGEQKHGANNWQQAQPPGMHFYEDALWRHLQARRMGETCADDSGLLHTAHLAWNALMLLDMELRGVVNPEWDITPPRSALRDILERSQKEPACRSAPDHCECWRCDLRKIVNGFRG